MDMVGQALVEAAWTLHARSFTVLEEPPRWWRLAHDLDETAAAVLSAIAAQVHAAPAATVLIFACTCGIAVFVRAAKEVREAVARTRSSTGAATPRME